MEKVMKGLGINLKSSKEYEPCKEVMPSRKLNYNVVCKTKCNVINVIIFLPRWPSA